MNQKNSTWGDFLKCISGERLIAYLFIILALVVLGAGYFHITSPELFKIYPLYKTLFLSIFYSLPTFVMGFLVVIYNINYYKDFLNNIFIILFLTSVFSIILLFAGLAVGTFASDLDVISPKYKTLVVWISAGILTIIFILFKGRPIKRLFDIKLKSKK